MNLTCFGVTVPSSGSTISKLTTGDTIILQYVVTDVYHNIATVHLLVLVNVNYYTMREMNKFIIYT